MTLEEIQSGILVFNVQAQEDREREHEYGLVHVCCSTWILFAIVAAAVAFINATIDKKDSSALLTALKLPGAGLTNVRDEQQVYYMTVLEAAKGNKREVRSGYSGCSSLYSALLSDKQTLGCEML